MGSLSVYKVVIDSSNRQGKCVKEYVGPARTESDAVERARATFKEGSGCSVEVVEVLDEEAWVEDAILPPDGDEGPTL